MEKYTLIATVVVWIAVAASVIAMVAYAGTTGAVFGFIVLIVALPVWARVLREGDQQKKAQQDEIGELKEQIKELTEQIKELKKSLEE